MIPSDYSRLELPVKHFESVDHYLATRDFTAGVRVIALPDGNHLDLVFTRELRAGAHIPVVFSGALTERTRKAAPPYVSGLGLAQDLDVPVVAVADPTLQADDEIILGWYAGQKGSQLQPSLTAVLKDIVDHRGPGVFVGGSGGGFASLFYAEQVGRGASAFAWNPQTDLLHYSPRFVRKYVGTALGDRKWLGICPEDEARAALVGAGIEPALPRLDRAGRAFVLQSASDWHVEAHALPFYERCGFEPARKGLHWTPSRRHVMAFGNFSEGHGAPQQELVHFALQQMMTGTMPGNIYDQLLDAGLLPEEDFGALPLGRLGAATSGQSAEQREIPREGIRD